MELIDIYDENNNYLGYSVERDEAHKKNLWHHHVSAWIMNYDGKILLQKRTLIKKSNPGRWSKTGGHVDSLETSDQAIKREVFEEIGLLLNDNDIKNVDVFKSVEPNNHYFSYGYIFLTDKKESEFELQKDEVSEVKYYSIEEIEQVRNQNNKDYVFCDWDEESFNNQIEILKKIRKKVISKKTI